MIAGFSYYFTYITLLADLIHSARYDSGVWYCFFLLLEMRMFGLEEKNINLV